jgi:eukaryotic-like serine/threonine-protein kinase
MAGDRHDDDATPAGAGEVSATLSAGDFGSPGPTGRSDGAARSEEPRGRVVGRYVILSLLGVGGMGAVYAAYDPELDRKVALKLLRPDSLSIDSARMLREARALARLAHPNVVAVHDVGTLGAEVFIAMEHVDGLTVHRWLRQRDRSRREVLDVFLAAGRGLAAAHRAGLVHRDFKPDNMMVALDGRVRVLDFGLARAQASAGAESTLREALIGDVDVGEARLTREGALLGTPTYMAPEQWRGAVADARSDQFSFCVALWEALLGERPFRGTTMQALMTSVTNGAIEAAPAGSRRVSSELRRARERGL